MNITLAVSLLAVTWLCLCAWSDLRTRRVSNGLTLPAILLALAYRLIAGIPNEEIFILVVVLLPLLPAWRNHLLGGADLKILLALALANPVLVAAAWIGVLLYFIGLLVFGEWRYRRSNHQNSEPLFAHSRPVRFAGVPGFALGAALFTAGQAASLLLPRLV